jgi:hypothetical protein
MKTNPARRLILGNTDPLITGVDKPLGFGEKAFPRSYDETRNLLLPQVQDVRVKIERLDPIKRYTQEAVVCFRIHPDFLAKSYELTYLWNYLDAQGAGMLIGVRRWRISPDAVLRTKGVEEAIAAGEKEVEGRLVFVRFAGDDGLRIVQTLLESKEAELPRAEIAEELRQVERIDLLEEEERVLGFDSEWSNGRVEVVLHPSSLPIDARKAHLLSFLKPFGAHLTSARFKLYEDNGVLFSSIRMPRESAIALGDYMPVRVVRPLNPPSGDFLRELGVADAPLPPSPKGRQPEAMVAVFDGGFNSENPFVTPFVQQRDDLCIKSSASDASIAHGTFVAGIVLHGSLNSVPAGTRLPPPEVGVIGVRVLPTSDPTDFDLYESIDAIEAAAPALSKETKIFNISLGPRGPIADDEVSRFTYALDLIAYTYGVLPVVAAGNDGKQIPDDLGRIQSPSDAANAMCVGSYAMKNGVPTRANYSCTGPGREGAKVKPDLLAFGGDELHPFHGVTSNGTSRLFTMGTSAAAPLVSRTLARVLNRCTGFDILMGRALVTHHAQIMAHRGEKNNECGFGLLSEDVDVLTACLGNSVTAIYQQTVLPGKYIRLDFPLPDTLQLEGRIKMTWTVAAMSPVDPLRPLEYTGQSFELFYFPHQLYHNISRYENGRQVDSKRVHLVDDFAEIERLTAMGWKRSRYPVTGGAKREGMLRKRDLKWDTVVSDTVWHHASSVYAPFLVLHAFERNMHRDPVRFAALVTITAESCPIDLYPEIRSRMAFLQPIQIRGQQQILP